MYWYYDRSSKVSFYVYFISKHWRNTVYCRFSCDFSHSSIGDHIVYVDDIWIDRDDKWIYMETNGAWEYISAFILHRQGIL
jgi:hypothetical protein